MATMQLNVVKEARSREAIESQITQWQENVERFRLDQLRLHTYIACLTAAPIPNAKVYDKIHFSVNCYFELYSMSDF